MSETNGFNETQAYLDGGILGLTGKDLEKAVQLARMHTTRSADEFAAKDAAGLRLIKGQAERILELERESASLKEGAAESTKTIHALLEYGPPRGVVSGAWEELVVVRNHFYEAVCNMRDELCEDRDDFLKTIDEALKIANQALKGPPRGDEL